MTQQLAEQFTSDEYIPPSAWGKDHWSTLAYVEHVATECKGFQVGFDGRMRANRRNYRVMQMCARPKRPNAAAMAVVMDEKHGSRLKDGSVMSQHDDWCCVQDMAEAGLFDRAASSIEPGVTLHLSAKGQAWVSALRVHKQAGGAYANFDVSAVSEIDSPAAAETEKEFFTWMGQDFNITAIHDDLAAGKIRPRTGTNDTEFIEGYATKVLGLKKDQPHATGRSLWAGVSAADVQDVPDAAYEKPVVFAFVGKNKGVLDLGDGAGVSYMLIDGNKRFGKAFFAGRASVNGVILSQAQTRKYKV